MIEYKFKADLEAHMKTHDKRFNCSHCEKTFQTEDSAQEHEKIDHAKHITSERICNDCPFQGS